MNNIINDWYIYIGILALVIACIWLVYRFFCLPTEKRLQKVREWLIWACIEAEKALKSGTGQLKLRTVWNEFLSVPAFSIVSRFITFDKFFDLVDEALLIVKCMIVQNPNLAEYVYSDNWQEEVEKIKLQLKKESANEGN